MCDVVDLKLAFKHLTGESENICRLCFDAVDAGISLEDSCVIECLYFDDNITYADMLTNLEVSSDSSLPQLLCQFCAELTMKAFCFQKLSQYSNKKWLEAVERLNQSLNSQGSFSHIVKTAYILVETESGHIVGSRKISKKVTKKAAAVNITKSVKSRKSKKIDNHRINICPQCGQKIKFGQLNEHLNSKHSKKEYPCPNCWKSFKDVASLCSHEERVHAPKKVPCPKCDQKFSSERKLECHMSKKHVAVKCKQCPQILPSRTALHYHSNKKHAHVKCFQCSKKFTSQKGLLQHSRKCGEDPDLANVICDICNKDFRNKQFLKKHMMLHGFGNIHTCKWCNKIFNGPLTLKQHIVKHTKEKNFSCGQCGNLFLSRMALKYHSRIHTGEKPYLCDLCGEKFLSASRRMDHMKRRHMEPQHECCICASKFATKSCLRKHAAKHKDLKRNLYIPELEWKIKQCNKNELYKQL